MSISFLNSLKINQFYKDVWILDTRDTTYMCSNTSYMESMKTVDSTPIFLPGGFIKSVTHTRVIELNSRLILKNDLHVPEFKCNQISVKSFVISTQIIFSFYPTFCILQDLEILRSWLKGR